MATTHPPPGFVTVADLEIDEVRPTDEGFELQGRGADASDYVLRMHLDMPIDRRTRAVLGEMLSQSEWTVWRRLDQRSRPGARHRQRSPSG